MPIYRHSRRVVPEYRHSRRVVPEYRHSRRVMPEYRHSRRVVPVYRHSRRVMPEYRHSRRFVPVYRHSRRVMPKYRHSRRFVPVYRHSRRVVPVYRHSRRVMPEYRHSRRFVPVYRHSRRVVPILDTSEGQYEPSQYNAFCLKMKFISFNRHEFRVKHVVVESKREREVGIMYNITPNGPYFTSLFEVIEEAKRSPIIQNHMFDIVLTTSPSKVSRACVSPLTNNHDPCFL